MSGSYFDLIAQEVDKQKRQMEVMLEENRALRRQLTELRAGHGIFVEVCGKRFALDYGSISSQSTATPKPVPASAQTQILPDTLLEYDALPSAPELSTPPPIEELSEEEAAEPVPVMSEEPKPIATFLEEIMIDEFVAASTSPMAVWGGPPAQTDKKKTAEEENAALRRELMGSYLLE